MKTHLQRFEDFLREAKDPTYYQNTFYFTILISMSKELGGSRDETKNDIRALSEVLTVTLVEPEKGGVQRDIGTKYLSTLKLHVRRPKDVNQKLLMKKIVLHVSNLRGVAVLRYKEMKPKPRRKAFHGKYEITEGEYYQSRGHKRDLQQAEKELTQTGPNKGGPLKNVTDEADWESAPPGAPGGLEETQPAPEKELSREERLREDIQIIIGAKPNELMAFDIQETLQPKLWKNEHELYAGVKAAIMDIVEEFLDNLGLDVDVADVIVTGSIANYNWSRFSDIDVHLLIDFAEINDNKEMVRKFFNSVRSNWNKLHTITIKGHEVELYIQDIDEPHVSTGVYSLSNDRWLVRPKKVKPEIDKETAIKKMLSLTREVDKLSKIYDNRQYQEALDMGERIKDKIKRMRRNGLEKTGVYSPENLAFKMLRRSGDIEQLFSIYTQAYDKLYSLDQ